MSKIADFALNFIAPKIIISTLQKQNPEELATEVAQTVDKFIDAEFGDKKSEQIQKVIVPWTARFIVAFNKELQKDAIKPN